MRENMVKIEIRPLEASSSRISESLAYPFFNFFSDFGGILGLYLGVSLLTLCDLGEYVTDIFRAVVKARYPKKIAKVGADNGGNCFSD